MARYPRSLGDVGAVFVGGLGGSAAREAVVAATSGPVAPLLIVNLTGSFLIGWLTAARERSGGSARLWVELGGIGFLGSFTTFSAFALVVVDGGSGIGAATVFALVSVVGGLVSAAAGRALGSAG